MPLRHATAVIAITCGFGGHARADLQPSTLSKGQQMAEMKWFIDAPKKLQLKGVREISMVSEIIATHEYESKTLVKAFEDIAGIAVKHAFISGEMSLTSCSPRSHQASRSTMGGSPIQI